MGPSASLPLAKLELACMKIKRQSFSTKTQVLHPGQVVLVRIVRSSVIIQIAVIEGTFLAIEHMSERKGGQGGTVINVASFGGGLETGMIAILSHRTACWNAEPCKTHCVYMLKQQSTL